MRLHNAPAIAAEPDEIDLTPMLDVVFILLIFFIVTASFIRESGLAANPAESEPASAATPDAIVVLIDHEDAFWIDRRRVQANALRANLLQLQSQHPDFPVIVQAAGGSTVQALSTALDMAHAAGIDDVVVAEAPADARSGVAAP